ncbi:MAG: Spy/CpxP family protein refolding chaperone [Isosphaeraceae bacterium]
MNACLFYWIAVISTSFSVTLPVQDAPPQPPGTVMPQGLGIGQMYSLTPDAVLLENAAVRSELKMTPEQVKALKTIEEEQYRNLEKFRTELIARMKEAQEAGDANQLSALSKQGIELRDSLVARTEEATRKSLTKSQLTRLREIQLQAEGPLALTRPEIQERLNLDEDQVGLIRGIIDEGRNSFREAVSSPMRELRNKPGNPRSATGSKEYQEAAAKGRENATKSRQETMQKIGKVLTRKQRQTFDRLLGEPFDLAAVREKREVRPAPAQPKP